MVIEHRTSLQSSNNYCPSFKENGRITWAGVIPYHTDFGRRHTESKVAYLSISGSSHLQSFRRDTGTTALSLHGIFSNNCVLPLCHARIISLYSMRQCWSSAGSSWQKCTILSNIKKNTGELVTQPQTQLQAVATVRNKVKGGAVLLTVGTPTMCPCKMLNLATPAE